ncbi:MAG: phenylalanine--tRNA ligase subunit beta [Patescibacteria group bacterium]|nr:phenylalanine--tRNA ligase subunit beta [Patescibacteria group bacterium]
MKLSLNWLKEFVRIKGDAAQVAEIFTLLGFEVEAIEEPGALLKKVITAKILKIKKHPQADKLHLVRVNDGKDVREIVCGANNIEPGQIVPLANEGVTLPNSQTIKRISIRGIESNGMLCSAKELGLGTDHTGIFILDKATKVGVALDKALDLDDVVLDITVSPNRADCLSVLGLAREYAAKTGQRVKEKKYPLREFAKPRDLSLAALKINEPKLCSKYVARTIYGVKVQDSPWWLKQRLLSAGVRPVNNVVDVTNYILMETGQPLHAFDADKISLIRGQRQIIVRLAKDGEWLFTLDGEKRQLDKTMLVIADSQKPLALAGVMGGRDSEVTPGTKNVVLEAAVFNPLAVRKASRRLGLRSESSGRFERGIDFEAVEKNSDQAASLIAKISGGRVARGKTVVSQKRPKNNKTVLFNTGQVSLLLGVDLPTSQIKKYFNSLGFTSAGSGKKLKITAPSWRQDIFYEADLIEEVGRLYGYNRLNPTYLKGELRPAEFQPDTDLVERLKDEMVRLGFTEVYNYSFYSEDKAAESGFKTAEHYQVANPLNREQKLMRTSLWPWLKNNIIKNFGNFDEFKIFEIGQVFWAGEPRPREVPMIGAAIVQKKSSPEKAFRELRGILESLNQAFRFNALFDFQPTGDSSYQIMANKSPIGVMRILSRSDIEKFSDTATAAFFEIRLDLLGQMLKPSQAYRSYSPYPRIVRDLAVEVNESVKFSDVARIICEINRQTISEPEPTGLISDINIFDEVYRGAKLGPNKKSLPIRLVFQSRRRTLENHEVDKIQGRISGELQRKLQAKIRGI